MPSAQLGLSCPQGGGFYTCETAKIRFIGCCTIDPCADGSGECPQDSLSVSSFSSDYYDDIPPQSCASPYDKSTWFTCASNSPPFIGCCNSNPCTLGKCPPDDLLAATLSENSTAAQAFLGADISSTPTPTATPASDHSSGSGYSLPVGGIIGIALGGGALVMIILAFLAYRCGWLARNKKTMRDMTATAPGGKLHDGSHLRWRCVLTRAGYSPSFATHWQEPPMGSPPNSPGHKFTPSSSPGYPPYPPQYPPSTASPPPAWYQDNKHISQASGMSWETQAHTQRQAVPLLAPTVELDGQEMRRHHRISELPSPPNSMER
ncbi:hypothetical protein F4780DRAFT_489947 [Xylariomycetidae sp. FL0641]|nr:hypothetical protein F4780DRAFT_489947 [Xylariomycetidae sp. FL0641]